MGLLRDMQKDGVRAGLVSYSIVLAAVSCPQRERCRSALVDRVAASLRKHSRVCDIDEPREKHAFFTSFFHALDHIVRLSPPLRCVCPVWQGRGVGAREGHHR